ncbi:hypothetical protein FSP39_002206 [Pinctada imbricata]|uniref:Uncharacterized protein n=1 Tax=Pinctada imbricata TaxID=66713 RepID=A0AA88Y4G6_PINIB|nr:hypothetical protein FSP39_002206 [Pinctada imbricata]
MASRVTPYFILTADGVATPDKPNSDVTSSQGDDGKEKASENKESKRKPSMSRNEITRKRMEHIQRKLDESRARHAEKIKMLNSSPAPRIGDAFLPHTPQPFLPTDGATKKVTQEDRSLEMIPLGGANNCNGGMPYVYFVVSVNKLSNGNRDLSSLDDSFADASISTIATQRRKTKHPVSRRRKRAFDDNPLQLSKSDGSFVQAPPLMRSVTMPATVPSAMPSNYPRNPPATPATITTYQDKTEDTEDKRDSLADLTDFNDNKSSQRGFSARLIELPYISLDQQRKNLGSSNASMEGKAMEVYRKSISQDSKRVHFAENLDLPNISGNGISIPRGLFAKNFGPRPTTMPAILSAREEFDKPRYVCPRTAFGTPRVKKNTQPLNLPKIDIVSGVYDELIVKAIETYIHEFPPGSKQTNLARQLLKQLKERTLTANDLAELERRTKSRGKLTIKEIDPDSAKSFEGGAKSSRNDKKRPCKPKADGEFSTLAPTCFQMAPPGSQSSRENTTLTAR